MYLTYKTAGSYLVNKNKLIILGLMLVYIPFQMYSLFYYSDSLMVVLVALIIYVLIPSDGSFIF